MKIAIIGAGNVGAAVGIGLAVKGHEIVFGVRNPEKPEVVALVETTGASSSLPPDAARTADVIVLALPWRVAEHAVAGLGNLTGKIVIDAMNPLTMTPDGLGLDRGYSTSGGETVAHWLPGSHVVKTLNQVGAEIMADTSGFVEPPVMFMAGDSNDAKKVVSALLSDLGFMPLDAGGLIKARLLEPFGMVWINQAIQRGHGREWAFGAMAKNKTAD